MQPKSGRFPRDMATNMAIPSGAGDAPRRFKLAPNSQPLAPTSTRRNWDPTIAFNLMWLMVGHRLGGFAVFDRFYIFIELVKSPSDPHSPKQIKKGKRHPGHLGSFFFQNSPHNP